MQQYLKDKQANERLMMQFYASGFLCLCRFGLYDISYPLLPSAARRLMLRVFIMSFRVEDLSHLYTPQILECSLIMANTSGGFSLSPEALLNRAQLADTAPPQTGMSWKICSASTSLRLPVSTKPKCNSLKVSN